MLSSLHGALLIAVFFNPFLFELVSSLHIYSLHSLSILVPLLLVRELGLKRKEVI